MKLSLLLSVYFKENPEYLKLALNSIFSQNIVPNEIVLVKDGPLSPELDLIIDEYQDKYQSIKVIPLLENKGLSYALNEGLIYCTNELVARMDTDDIAYPNRLEKQLFFMNENKHIDIVGSFATTIDEYGIEGDIMRVPISHEEILKYIWTCPFIHPSVMFRKSKIQNIGSYNPNAGPRQDDYELWFRCAINGLKFANIPEPLLYYRFFSDSLRKNNLKVGWHRFKVGFKGCRKLNAPPFAYIGITIPLLRSVMPYPLNKWFQELMNKVNPRHK